MGGQDQSWGDASLGRGDLTAPVMKVLSASDPDATIAFFRDVLGFSELPVGGDGDARAVAELALGPARLQIVPVAADGAGPARQVLFLETADVTAARDAIRDRGGHPSDLTRVNWIKYELFEVRDPDGHTVWFGQSFNRPYDQAAEPMLEKALPILPCDDVAAAVAHYRDVLGFHVNYQQHDLGVMDRDAITLLLVPRGPDGQGRGAAEFYVRDADALHAELTSRGAGVEGPPVSHPWGLRDFHVRDLSGNRLSFAQPFE